MIITGQKPLRTSKQARFQVLDIVEMMKPVTKHASSIRSGEKIPVTVREAFRVADAERPGAVHIEFAEDVSAETVDKTIEPIPVVYQRRPDVDATTIGLMVDKIKKAKCPVLLIGSGANRKRISNFVTEFVKKTNMPFFASQM